ncbi:MAG: PEP-utilizing enzyme, partial [Acidimicrobiales bacterium]
MDQGADQHQLRFPGPDEIDGFWSHDRIHAPRPMTSLAFDLITDTLAIGFTRAHAEYGAPLDMHSRAVHHYLYSSLRPVTDEVELARRAERYAELPRLLDEVGMRWETEWKPDLVERVRAGRARDYRGLTNAELAAELDRQRDDMIDQWTIHGRINFATVAGARFVDFYTEALAPSDPNEGYAVLQGYVTQTVRATDELWRLSRLVRSSSELSRLFDLPTPDLARALNPGAPGTETASAPVADFARELRAFLDEYGWRSDAVYDVGDVTWREDPSIPLDSLRGYAALDDGHDPRLAFDRAAERRDDLLARARAALAGDPELLGRFERYHDAARHNLPVTEDHAFWIDQSGVANVRRFLLQVGERLVATGCLDDPSEVFHLRRDEVQRALADGGDWRATAAGRRATMVAAAALDAPPTLGTPPPPAPEGQALDPLFDAIANRLAGRRRTPAATPGSTMLTGHPASGGTATGPAKVVRSLAEAAKLQPGDVLVCEMTLPPWVPLFAVAAAVVADTGGQMSHCAIVAREFGLPAVVGT